MAMATTETSATDSKIILKDTTEQNKTDSRDEHMTNHQVLFCSVVPFLIIAAVSVVAIMVSIDKIRAKISFIPPLFFYREYVFLMYGIF